MYQIIFYFDYYNLFSIITFLEGTILFVKKYIFNVYISLDRVHSFLFYLQIPPKISGTALNSFYIFIHPPCPAINTHIYTHTALHQPRVIYLFTVHRPIKLIKAPATPSGKV